MKSNNQTQEAPKKEPKRSYKIHKSTSKQKLSRTQINLISLNTRNQRIHSIFQICNIKHRTLEDNR